MLEIQQQNLIKQQESEIVVEEKPGKFKSSLISTKPGKVFTF